MSSPIAMRPAPATRVVETDKGRRRAVTLGRYAMSRGHDPQHGGQLHQLSTPRSPGKRDE